MNCDECVFYEYDESDEDYCCTAEMDEEISYKHKHQPAFINHT